MIRMIVSYIPRDEPVTIAVRLFCSVAKLRVHLGASVEARGSIVSFGEACHSACVGKRNAMVTCVIDHYVAVHDEVKRRCKYEGTHLVEIGTTKRKNPTRLGVHIYPTPNLQIPGSSSALLDVRLCGICNDPSCSSNLVV
jgi:hypothetical protein